MTGWTPFHRTSNWSKHNFLNIEGTSKFSCIDNQATYLWLQKEWINIILSTTHYYVELPNYSSKRLQHLFSETCSCIGNGTRTPYLWFQTSRWRIFQTVRIYPYIHIADHFRHFMHRQNLLKQLFQDSRTYQTNPSDHSNQTILTNPTKQSWLIQPD